ncbi:MAG: FAD-dependent thymidylate synthase, partial [bacterium]
MKPFLSEEPEVVLVNGFTRAFDNAVAAARTCYSAKGIITPEEVAGELATDPEKAEEIRRRRVELAKDIFEAGHHTVFQHAHFQFALNRVSRHFVWSFLHSHPFYNSEQVSQRYVEVKPDTYFVPMLDGESREVYEGCVAMQMDAYHRLIELLTAPAGAEY